MLNASVISHVGIGRLFDVADQPADDFRRLRVRLVVGRVNRDCGPVLPRIIDDLTNDRGKLVDGETWPRAGRISLALLPDALRPLLRHAGEFDVGKRVRAVSLFLCVDFPEGVARLLENVRGQELSHP